MEGHFKVDPNTREHIPQTGVVTQYRIDDNPAGTPNLDDYDAFQSRINEPFESNPLKTPAFDDFENSDGFGEIPSFADFEDIDEFN